MKDKDFTQNQPAHQMNGPNHQGTNNPNVPKQGYRPSMPLVNPSSWPQFQPVQNPFKPSAEKPISAPRKGSSLKLIITLFITLAVVALVAYYLLAEKNKQYNVILISLTNIGADHLGLYGYERDTSPALDAFAQKSIVFEEVYSPSSWTLPSGISMFTSNYPYEHKVMDRFIDEKLRIKGKLSRNIPSVIDVLHEEGYMTAAFTGGFDYRPGFGLTDRFDVYVERLANLLDTFTEEYVHELKFGSITDMFPESLKWIDSQDDQRFFLFLQGYDTHCPFSPSKKYAGLFMQADQALLHVNNTNCYRGFEDQGGYISFTEENIGAFAIKDYDTLNLTKYDTDYLEAQYDSEVRMVDDGFAQFLAELEKRKLLKNTIIIITAEHGEMFAGHGRFGRAGTVRGTLYDDVVHVPLMIYHPDFAPKRVAGLASIMDISPTILAMLDFQAPSSFQGKNLLELYEGGKIHDHIFGGSVYGTLDFRYYEARAINEYVRDSSHILLHEETKYKNGTAHSLYELYNIKVDPKQTKDIFNEQPELAKGYQELLQTWSGPLLDSYEVS